MLGCCVHYPMSVPCRLVKDGVIQGYKLIGPDGERSLQL